MKSFLTKQLSTFSTHFINLSTKGVAARGVAFEGCGFSSILNFAQLAYWTNFKIEQNTHLSKVMTLSVTPLLWNWSVNITSIHTVNQIQEYHRENIRLISFIKLKTKVYNIILTHYFRSLRSLMNFVIFWRFSWLKTIRHTLYYKLELTFWSFFGMNIFILVHCVQSAFCISMLL